jgi:hypothetical protein
MAQPAPPELLQRCGGMFDLCGFVDRKSGVEVIPRRFEVVQPFSEGLAGVRINGRYGFIDETGAVAIAPRFDEVGRFYQGLAEVLVEGKAGVIDRRGDIVVPPRFERAIPFTKHVIIARNRPWWSDLPWLGTLSSHLRPYPNFDGFDGRFGLYSISAGWLTRQDFYLSQFEFETEGRGLIWATTQDRYTGPFGLLRADGTWQIEPQYSHVQRLMDERAIVRIPNQGAPWPPADLDGAVDPDGKVAVPFGSWHLSYWANGLGLVHESAPPRAGVKVGLIDKAGRILGGRLFDDVKRAEKGEVSQVLLDGKWVGLDREGRIVANPEDGAVLAECPTGVRLVKQSGMVQVLGPDGQPTVPFLLDNLPVELDCSQPLLVKSGSRYGYVGADGRLLGDPPFFDSSHAFAAGYGVVQRDGKWGIIDAAGRFTVDLQYDDLRPAGKGLYIATKAGQTSWITATGVEQPQPAAEPVDRSGYLKCGPHAGTIIGRRDPSGAMAWGIADPSGQEILAPVHRAISCFRNGVAWAPIDARRQWCALGPDGALRDAPACIPEHYPWLQTHSQPEHFSDDPYENSVLFTQAFLEYGAGLRATPPQMIVDRNAVSFSFGPW